jgi:two-component system, chemotaxis family, response regulator Rcp1
MAGKELDILLVEDSMEDVELLDIALKESKVSYRINVCDDGEKALLYLYRQNPYENAVLPDIVVLDLNLPKKDGREVLREIRQRFKNLPVLVMTTSVTPSSFQNRPGSAIIKTSSI